MNNQEEANLIQQLQTSFNKNESYWIGGSSSNDSGSVINLSEYIPWNEGNILIISNAG